MAPRRVVLYTRAGCHLCDEARAVLIQVQAQVPFELEEVDILSDPDLFQEHKWDIPVIEIDGRTAFKLRVAPEALVERLQR
jgi:glutaredoxin